MFLIFIQISLKYYLCLKVNFITEQKKRQVFNPEEMSKSIFSILKVF